MLWLWTVVPCVCGILVQFAAQEDKRQKNERLHQHQKHENQMRDLQLQCDSNIRELQQLQVHTRLTCFRSHFKHWAYFLIYADSGAKGAALTPNSKMVHGIEPHPGVAAGVGLLDLKAHFLTEWEMPHSDWTRNPKVEGAGWGAQPRDKGVEGEAQAQEEGICNILWMSFMNTL